VRLEALMRVLAVRKGVGRVLGAVEWDLEEGVGSSWAAGTAATAAAAADSMPPLLSPTLSMPPSQVRLFAL